MLRLLPTNRPLRPFALMGALWHKQGDCVQRFPLRLAVLTGVLWALLLAGLVSPLAAVGVGAPTQVQDSVTLPQTVRVATWNVRNYMAMDRHYEGVYRRDYPKPEAEKAALRQILLAVRPDVLVLQEIGGAAYLAELQADLRREGLDYPYAAIATTTWLPDGAGREQRQGGEFSDGIDADADRNVGAADAEPSGLAASGSPQLGQGDRLVAVLSRLPWDGVREEKLALNYFGKRRPLVRALLEIEFKTAHGSLWSVYSLHLKSRFTDRKDDPESRILRTAEAMAIRNHIARRHPPQSAPRFLIAGDFNDTQGSAPLRRFLKRGDTVLTQAVRCTDSRGELWTYFWEKEATYQLVDYILASPALVPFVGEGAIADHLPQSRIASDHRLVYVDVDTHF